MNWSVLAILARFKGDRLEAVNYCAYMARTYPRLTAEYWQLMDVIRDQR